nr:NAD-dependent epimerase/dehydratase family protein [Haliscomenobacter sp.]
MEKSSKIYIAGHRGMVGSAIRRCLEKEGYHNLVTRTSSELDLRNQAAVTAFFELEQPEYVFLAAAKVGGIDANNTYRGEFLYDNLMIQNNVIHSSKEYGVKKVAVSGIIVYLPKTGATTAKRRILALRFFRAYQ